jgi:flagellar hook-basal body protein
VTGHGYTTGKQIQINGGTLPTATPPLSSGISYFVRRVDADTITLHTTAADAAAGSNPIKYSTQGIGPFELLPGASISSWNVGTDGKVNMLLTDGTQYVRGQVLLQKFTNPNALMRLGQNLYANLGSAGPLTSSVYTSSNSILSAAGTAQSQGLGRIEGGALELSNVDMAKEFATMITTQRAFQANARVITTSDEVLMEMMQLKR